MLHPQRRLATALAVAGAASALFLAPSATAAPDCTNTAPNTRLCTTNGSAQLTTSPGTTSPPYGGWPFGYGYGGGLVLNFGGIGLGF
jgi:hypothetical protein